MLSCGIVAVVIFVLSVMHVVEGVIFLVVCVLVSDVHPVTILSVFCSLLMFCVCYYW